MHECLQMKVTVKQVQISNIESRFLVPNRNQRSQFSAQALFFFEYLVYRNDVLYTNVQYCGLSLCGIKFTSLYCLDLCVDLLILRIHGGRNISVVTQQVFCSLLTQLELCGRRFVTFVFSRFQFTSAISLYSLKL